MLSEETIHVIKKTVEEWKAKAKETKKRRKTVFSAAQEKKARFTFADCLFGNLNRN